MPVLNGVIQPEGALVDIVLGWGAAHVAQLQTALKPIPQPVPARALLDSGAEESLYSSLYKLAAPKGIRRHRTALLRGEKGKKVIAVSP